MKKSLKIIAAILSIFFVVIISFLIYSFTITSGTNLNEEKLVNMQRTVNIYDDKNELISERVGGVSVTEFSDIPTHTKNAFVAIEDKRFYSHKGIDYRGLLRASFNNLKSFSFKEGASTISQQLIKNTHLTNEKTLKRKILEIKLAKQLEKKFSKDEILEKYLNTIYFGDGCYGITAASKHYFNKKTCELDLNESAVLAGIIKAPSNYSPFNNPEKCNERKNVVLKEMLLQSYISEKDYNKLKETDIILNKIESKIENYNLISLAEKEVYKILNNSPYSSDNLNIYTSQNSNYQSILSKILCEDYGVNAEKSAVLMDNKGKILAYASTCGNVNRQLGSIIKPILVYAPAINENLVNSCTFINDEKTDFNGYSPANYKDVYSGYISVKNSLAKSSNVCAVKLLNTVGVNNAINYAKKCGLNFCDEDNSLCLALGASKFGDKLINITSAYNVFSNHGNYNYPKCIENITTISGQNLYNIKNRETKVINKDTASIMNDMLRNVVLDGTAKKLSNLPFPVYAKTGTVGVDNGNSDAYCISYNKDLTLGVWIGSKSGEFLANSISGGSIPATISCELWEEIYKDTTPPKEIQNEGVVELSIDKIAYDEERKIILADKNAPERYKTNVLFKSSCVPIEVSKRFSEPKIDNSIITVNNYGILIKLCHAEYCDALVYKKINNVKTLVFDTRINGDEFLDRVILPNTVYTYSVVPYFYNNDKIIKGKEVVLEKIKSPRLSLGDEWWLNEFN